MKLLVVGDIHLAKGSPGRRTSTYMTDILAKLDETVRIAKSEQVDAVVWVGDVYHNPRADKVPHELTKAVSVRARQYSVPLYVLPGNHDMRAGDLESVYVSQPIALLDELDNVTLLRWEPVQISSGVTLYPVPGVPHVPIEEYVRRFPSPASSESFNFFVVHQSISRDGAGSYPFPHVGADEFAENLPWVDFVSYGHLHEDYGWYEVGGVTFCNFGSICRGTISESDLKKEPKVYTLEVVDSKAVFENVKTFVLPHRPVSEVFELEGYLQEKSRRAELQEYASSLQRISVRRFSVDEVISNIDARADVDESVKAFTIDCINRAR